jgi:hypothetical protein
MNPRRNWFKAATAAFASNAVNPNLRRAQLSFLGAWTAEWAFTVALGIFAYRNGGPTAVALVGLLRMVPSAVVAPLGLTCDRFLPVVTGFPPSARQAGTSVEEMLDRFSPGEPPEEDDGSSRG